MTTNYTRRFIFPSPSPAPSKLATVTRSLDRQGIPYTVSTEPRGGGIHNSSPAGSNLLQTVICASGPHVPYARNGSRPPDYRAKLPPKLTLDDCTRRLVAARTERARDLKFLRTQMRANVQGGKGRYWRDEYSYPDAPSLFARRDRRRQIGCAIGGIIAKAKIDYSILDAAAGVKVHRASKVPGDLRDYLTYIARTHAGCRNKVGVRKYKQGPELTAHGVNLGFVGCEPFYASVYAEPVFPSPNLVLNALSSRYEVEYREEMVRLAGGGGV